MIYGVGKAETNRIYLSLGKAFLSARIAYFVDSVFVHSKQCPTKLYHYTVCGTFRTRSYGDEQQIQEVSLVR